MSDTTLRPTIDPATFTRTDEQPQRTIDSSLLSRVCVFAYGMAMYNVGVAGLVALILATLGFLPFTGGPIALESAGAKVALNLGLVALFGIQHAIMARPRFKAWWTTVIPAAAERATFTGISGVLMGLAVWLWQPMPQSVWSTDVAAVRYGLMGLCAFGWTYLLTATFAIDHFELFGVKQVVRNLRGLPTPSPAFQERLMYRFDRHPIMTGVLIGLWSTATMNLDQLVLALGFTAYIVIGVSIEVRDLRREHGDGYRDYERRVRTIVPTIRLRRTAATEAESPIR